MRSWTATLLVLAACDAGAVPPAPSDSSQPPSGDGSVIVELDEPFDASGLRQHCAIGSDAGSELDEPSYVLLEPGGPIPIGGVGQAGLTAKLAFRCTPASEDERSLADVKVYAELILTNAFTKVVAPREPEPVGVSIACLGETCDGAFPIEISHLAKLPELEGLKVRADLRVLSSEGELVGRDRTHGVLAPR